MSASIQDAIFEKHLKDMAASLGYHTDFNLVFRSYSRTYHGTFNPAKNRITLYIFDDPSCDNPRKYNSVINTFLHELVHHHQWNHDPKFVRRRGVMHDPRFHTMLWRAKENAKTWGYYKTETSSENLPLDSEHLDESDQGYDLLGVTSLVDFRVV